MPCRPRCSGRCWRACDLSRLRRFPAPMTSATTHTIRPKLHRLLRCHARPKLLVGLRHWFNRWLKETARSTNPSTNEAALLQPNEAYPQQRSTRARVAAETRSDADAERPLAPAPLAIPDGYASHREQLVAGAEAPVAAELTSRVRVQPAPINSPLDTETPVTTQTNVIPDERLVPTSMRLETFVSSVAVAAPDAAPLTSHPSAEVPVPIEVQGTADVSHAPSGSSRAARTAASENMLPAHSQTEPPNLHRLSAAQPSSADLPVVQRTSVAHPLPTGSSDNTSASDSAPLRPGPTSTSLPRPESSSRAPAPGWSTSVQADAPPAQATTLPAQAKADMPERPIAGSSSASPAAIEPARTPATPLFEPSADRTTDQAPRLPSHFSSLDSVERGAVSHEAKPPITRSASDPYDLSDAPRHLPNSSAPVTQQASRKAEPGLDVFSEQVTTAERRSPHPISPSTARLDAPTHPDVADAPTTSETEARTGPNTPNPSGGPLQSGAQEQGSTPSETEAMRLPSTPLSESSDSARPAALRERRPVSVATAHTSTTALRLDPPPTGTEPELAEQIALGHRAPRPRPAVTADAAPLADDSRVTTVERQVLAAVAHRQTAQPLDDDTSTRRAPQPSFHTYVRRATQQNASAPRPLGQAETADRAAASLEAASKSDPARRDAPVAASSHTRFVTESTQPLVRTAPQTMDDAQPAEVPPEVDTVRAEAPHAPPHNTRDDAENRESVSNKPPTTSPDARAIGKDQTSAIGQPIQRDAAQILPAATHPDLLPIPSGVSPPTPPAEPRVEPEATAQPMPETPDTDSEPPRRPALTSDVPLPRVAEADAPGEAAATPTVSRDSGDTPTDTPTRSSAQIDATVQVAAELPSAREADKLTSTIEPTSEASPSPDSAPDERGERR